jgi:hypothetical protein
MTRARFPAASKVGGGMRAGITGAWDPAWLKGTRAPRSHGVAKSWVLQSTAQVHCRSRLWHGTAVSKVIHDSKTTNHMLLAACCKSKHEEGTHPSS